MKDVMEKPADAPKPKRVKRARRTSPKPAGAPRHAARGGAGKAREKGEPCPRCNEHHTQPGGKPSCNGHVKYSDPLRPCTRAPIRGGAVCRVHGANALVRANAEKRVAWEAAEGEVAALLRECDIPEQHPIDGLLEVVRHSGAMMRLLGFMCSQLDLDPEVQYVKTKEGDTLKVAPDTAMYGYNHNNDQATHVLVAMYGQWSDRYARACKLALDANIDERMVRNAEATTQVFYQAVTEAINAAALTPEQSAAFGKTLATQLRKVVGPLDLAPKQGIAERTG